MVAVQERQFNQPAPYFTPKSLNSILGPSIFKHFSYLYAGDLVVTSIEYNQIIILNILFFYLKIIESENLVITSTLEN